MPPQERKKPGFLSPGEDSRAAKLLQFGEVEVIGRLPYSSNRTFLARCCDDDGEVLAVYKPVAGERPLHDFRDGTLYRREVAAYVLDHAVGWGFVPMTVARRNLPLGEGALQLFVDHDAEQHYFTLLEDHRPTFRRMAVFDILSNNADRKSGHCIIDGDGHIWGVDHGLTFNAEPKLRTVIWDFAGEQLPETERQAVGRLAARLADPGDDLSRRLLRLLDPLEIDALNRRAEGLKQPGVFPHPDSSWSFPWPLV